MIIKVLQSYYCLDFFLCCFVLKFLLNVNMPVVRHASAPMLHSERNVSIDWPISGNQSTTVLTL